MLVCCSPTLICSMLYRRGRKADERYEYRTALESYTTGLNTMQAVINRGILTHRYEYRTALQSYTTWLNTMQAVIIRGILTPRYGTSTGQRWSPTTPCRL